MMDDEEEAGPAHVAALKAGMKGSAPEEGAGEPDDDKQMLLEICDALSGVAGQPGTKPEMAQALIQACELIAPFAAKGGSGESQEDEEGPPSLPATDEGGN